MMMQQRYFVHSETLVKSNKKVLTILGTLLLRIPRTHILYIRFEIGCWRRMFYAALPIQKNWDFCIHDKHRCHRNFYELNAVVEETLKSWFRKGRGKRNKFPSKDIFFMAVMFLKCGGTWDNIAFAFMQKKARWRKLWVLWMKLFVSWFIKLLSEIDQMYGASQYWESRTFNIERSRIFYALVVRFEQALCPAASHEDT